MGDGLSAGQAGGWAREGDRRLAARERKGEKIEWEKARETEGGRESERNGVVGDIDSSKSTAMPVAQMGAWTGVHHPSRYQITSRYVVQRQFIPAVRPVRRSSVPPAFPCPLYPGRCKFHYWPTDSAALNATTRVYRAFIESERCCVYRAWLSFLPSRMNFRNSRP